MCDTCGCGDPHLHPHDHAHDHAHDHTHHHEHGHGHSHDHVHDHAHGHAHPPARTIEVQKPALALNQRYADQNRGWFRAKGLTVFNLLSSPGSGKTTLLEHTLRAVPGCAAVVGDLQTENDANRLRATGAPAVQITTGATCHLDAHMVAHALPKLNLDGVTRLFIENVGNLVCPASYDLGENRRVVLLSVTEGEDKPQKYPVIFHNADLVLITKCDLAEAVGFDRDKALTIIRQVAPRAQILEVSARTGQGMAEWQAWLSS
ncbi:MAG TPA: hydrogenase nickel incorporation protein HypB [Kiritimatiellia bacterium]|jgi:hydrogenase nickel incorporation protein HypB|nr:MAG: Hydrogenase isoenzymes nickel incorporation protein HypB [Verrucomicrobia bacterium ADurb.Bin018]HOE00077.1 hydrogenase nickel incorporation protein HypB [Kiritimatiellia bacterium]HOE36859.1 hydrogenase nickel incorporation protein HypB [Kiritimatiellia bacterium]HOR74209.1 hydrogenase nickel incorporation protein HypB [Kiritimatiellia bacterium]HOU58016.1 hydrogenase nickel incorporation protein HypB [Kiritimatiellia bacterium]